MENKVSRKSEILNIVFSVLLFGGLWGIVEASLGSLLHMPFIHRTMFLSSTTILVPIALGLMGACYKRTGSYRSVLYMGLLAASMKAIACAIFKMSFNPCYYILMESVSMMAAVLIIRPKKVVSFAGLATMIIASTLYLGTSTVLRVNLGNGSVNKLMDNITKYMFTYNCVAILYTFVAGAIIYGILKLVEVKAWNVDKVKKLIFHPAFAGSMSVIALVLTIVLH